MESFYFVGAIVLVAALGYGLIRDRGRNKRNDALTEAATREEYEHPERYARTQDVYKRAADEQRPH